AGMGADQAKLIVDVSSEGMSIMIARKGGLSFDYFYSWKNIQEEDRSIPFEKLKQIISTEIGKVINFSLSRFGNEIKDIVVNAEGLSEKVTSLIKEQFPAVSVSSLSIPEGLTPSWAAAFGASIRGKMARSEDDLISLGPLTVIEEYRQGQMLDIISLWGKVVAGILVFTIFIMGAGDIFLRRIRLNVGSTNIRGLSGEELTEYSTLSAKAAELNKLVILVGEAKNSETTISPFIEKISGLNSDIKITRIAVRSLAYPVSINGTASSADAVSRFHKQLAAMSGVSDIQFPLSSLVSIPEGRVAFTMSFKVQSFDLR
ncbi:MAG: hypothetical protein PHP35_01350, partial [Candidatus Colwellbacteria bacterium]|nr:hypothetical protein [Candidatus Colwellbacteria bacterium]